MNQRFRCTECDHTWQTFELAASCHPGIGGVVDTAKFEFAADTPLAQRRAAAREIARMASVRSRIDDVIRELRLTYHHLDELADSVHGQTTIEHEALDAGDLVNAAIDHMLTCQRALDV